MQQTQRIPFTILAIATFVLALSLAQTALFFSKQTSARDSFSINPDDVLEVAPLDLHQGLIADPETKRVFIPPRYDVSQRAPESTFHVNWNASTCGGDTAPWPVDAQNAFYYAVNIWESVVVSNIPIEIDACWRPLGTNVLGYAGPTTIRRNFPNVSTPDTWYQISLVNHLSGTDANGDDAEIIASFSSQFTNWYFGTDGNPGFNQYDFVTVVIHELAHGLGFAGSMDISSGVASYGFDGDPTSYDRRVLNNDGVFLVGGFDNNSAALAAQLVGENIYLGGVEVLKANGDANVKIHAPANWQRGLSFAHLDDIFDGSVNALMTHSIANGEAIHDPGPITLALLADMGWKVTDQPPVSTLTAQIYLPLVVRE